MKRHAISIGSSLFLGLGLSLLLLCLLSGRTTAGTTAPESRPRRALGDVITVCLAGACDFSSVQDAVDAASPGDVIKVAQGTYTDVHTRAGITQVVYVSKTVVVRGGYTITNNFAEPSDLVVNPTKLDAQGKGRVLYVTGDISPTIEGLHIVGGDASGLGGESGDPSSWEGAGGGVYVITATPIVSNNYVCHNAAYMGGGLYLYHSAATLSGNTVVSNSNDLRYYGGGGAGIYLHRSAATLSDNFIAANETQIDGQGGGLYLDESDATLSGNTISANYGNLGGGGLILWHSNATLSGNDIVDNTGSNSSAGLELWYSDATLSANSIISNAAQYGGGVCMWHSDATLSGNTIMSNVARSRGHGFGGGLYLSFDSDAVLINNVVANNRARDGGGGLYIEESSPRLLHTTIAHNSGGKGDGVYVADTATVFMTNTIIVSQTVGITVTAGGSVTLNGVLWHRTPTTVSQASAGTASVQNQYLGDPVFVDADLGDYHIGPASAAADQGIDAGVDVDMDGEPRPAPSGTHPDLGADEISQRRVYLPMVLRESLGSAER